MSQPSCARFLEDPSPWFYLESWYLALVYYIVLPLLALFGCVGNCLCLIVIVKKFLKEPGFRYQIAIIIVDTAALFVHLLYIASFHFGFQYMIPFSCQELTRFAFEKHYALMVFAVYFVRPLRAWLTGAGPYLLIGTNIDRILALKAPLFYRNRLPIKALHAFSILVGLVMSSGIVFVNVFTIVLVPKNNSTYFGIALEVGPEGIVFSVITSLSRTFCFLALIGTSVVLTLSYRRFMATYAASGQLNTGETPGLVTSKLQAELLFAQIFLVLISSLPFIIIHVLFNILGAPYLRDHLFNLLWWLNLFNDIGGVVQSSLNVVVYSAVSSRFKKAILKQIGWKASVAPSSTGVHPTA